MGQFCQTNSWSSRASFLTAGTLGVISSIWSTLIRPYDSSLSKLVEPDNACSVVTLFLCSASHFLIKSSALSGWIISFLYALVRSLALMTTTCCCLNQMQQQAAIMILYWHGLCCSVPFLLFVNSSSNFKYLSAYFSSFGKSKGYFSLDDGPILVSMSLSSFFARSSNFFQASIFFWKEVAMSSMPLMSYADSFLRYSSVMNSFLIYFATLSSASSFCLCMNKPPQERKMPSQWLHGNGLQTFFSLTSLARASVLV